MTLGEDWDQSGPPRAIEEDPVAALDAELKKSREFAEELRQDAKKHIRIGRLGAGAGVLAMLFAVGVTQVASRANIKANRALAECQKKLEPLDSTDHMQCRENIRAMLTEVGVELTDEVESQILQSCSLAQGWEPEEQQD